MFAHFTTVMNTATPCLTYQSLGYSIPLIIQSYSISTENAQLNVLKGIPYFSKTTHSAAPGFQLSQGALELPKLNIGGVIDTPFTATPILEARKPQILFAVTDTGNRVSYGDVISMAANGDATQPVIDPTFFIDPFKRRFDNPRVIDFSASYVAGAPGRQQFQLKLLLRKGSRYK